MQRIENFKQAADYYLTMNAWLASRYSQTDKHGRRWLAQYTNGNRPTKYKRLEHAFYRRYVLPFKNSKEG
jgi:lipopolysaccharide export LptBFGC system permease protein LptF